MLFVGKIVRCTLFSMRIVHLVQIRLPPIRLQFANVTCAQNNEVCVPFQYKISEKPQCLPTLFIVKPIVSVLHWLSLYALCCLASLFEIGYAHCSLLLTIAFFVRRFVRLSRSLLFGRARHAPCGS